MIGGTEVVDSHTVMTNFFLDLFLIFQTSCSRIGIRAPKENLKRSKKLQDMQADLTQVLKR